MMLAVVVVVGGIGGDGWPDVTTVPCSNYFG